MVWWLWAQQVNPFLSGLMDMNGSANPVDGATDSLSKHGLQACCMWTPEDGFYQFSDNWGHVTGQLPQDCMEAGWVQSWHPKMQQMFAQAVSDMYSPAPEDRTESVVIEGDVMRGDGQWATLELALLDSGAANTQKLTVLVVDVTEHRNMQSQVALAELQSRAIEHCRSSFLSNMSHELRTPLNAIMGFAQMLEMQQAQSEEGAKEYLQHILMSGNELLTKIGDLIELANIDAGHAKLYDEAFVLSDLVDSAIEMQSHHAFQKRVRVQRSSNCPQLTMQADRSRIMHCLTHLLADAIDQSPEGGVVEIAFHADAKAGVTLLVNDHGAGMSQRRLQNIRTSLRRMKSYYQTDIEDVSIGLAVCKEIMDLHGGKLAIDSLIGRGTTASLQFPASRILSMKAEKAAAPKRKRPQATKKIKKATPVS